MIVTKSRREFNAEHNVKSAWEDPPWPVKESPEYVAMFYADVVYHHDVKALLSFFDVRYVALVRWIARASRFQVTCDVGTGGGVATRPSESSGYRSAWRLSLTFGQTLADSVIAGQRVECRFLEQETIAYVVRSICAVSAEVLIECDGAFVGAIMYEWDPKIDPPFPKGTVMDGHHREYNKGLKIEMTELPGTDDGMPLIEKLPYCLT